MKSIDPFLQRSITHNPRVRAAMSEEIPDVEIDAQVEQEPEMFRCRHYENKYPEVDDLIVVKVQSIADIGAYVSLLEYENIEGMIPLTELSNRRIRSFSKLIRVGRIEIAVVLRVDKEKGYIDLSKRRVATEEIVKCEERWNKSKCVQSIMTRVAKTVNRPLIEVHQEVAWPLYKKYGHAYDAFRMYMSDNSLVPEIDAFPADVRIPLLENVKRRLQSSAVKIRADIDVTCFRYEGIDAIKDALRAGMALSTDKTPITINLIAPPSFVLTTTVMDKEKGLELLTSACDAISAKIKENGGDMTVKIPPRAITDRDEKSLASTLEQLEKQAQEELEAEFD